MDVSKQLVSSGAAHISGILIAVLVQAAADGSRSGTSECSWYAVVFSVDTTLGVGIALALHALAVRVAASLLRGIQGEQYRRRSGPTQADAASLEDGSETEGDATIWADIAVCGNYGEPPSARRWVAQVRPVSLCLQPAVESGLAYQLGTSHGAAWVQLTEFTVCVVAARLCCAAFVLLLSPALVGAARALDRAFENHPVALLFTVMICCPVLMNVAQAWVQDQFLAWRSPGGTQQSQGDDLVQLLPPVGSPQSLNRGAAVLPELSDECGV